MIKVGISQCLLGANVRFNGGHKNHNFCSNELSRLFEFTPLCPEIGIGLPVPRKTIRLVGDLSSPKAVLSDADLSQQGFEDFTQPLADFANSRVDVLSQLSGYILAKGSPSCGLERVKVYNDKGQPDASGVGIFAARLQKLFPLLPMEEDGRLNDPLLRDSFIKRVYLYNEWQQLTQQNKLTVNAFIKFHSRHKMTLLAHCQKTYRKIGPLVASARPNNLTAVSQEYIGLLLAGFKKPATRRNNTNVLLHLQGHLKTLISKEDKAELLECITDYNKGVQPILAPLTLLKHHFKNNPKPYISQLSYFSPYPKELAIRVAVH